MRRFAAPFLGLALLAGPAAAAASAAQDQAQPARPAAPAATTRVTYIGGPSVYVEAGREDGLRAGDVLEVVRDGKTIAKLTVTYLSAHRAACSVATSSDTIVVGDQVRYAPSGPVAPKPGGSPSGAAGGVGVAPGSPAAPGGARHDAGLHGRVGVRYLAVRDHTGAEAGFSQPAVDLWLADYGLGATDLFVDVRARRTYRTRAGLSETDGLSNVYRLAGIWHPADPRQTVTIGRQSAPALAVVSLFDGALYEFNAGSWSTGVFGGTQPDPVDLKVSGDIREFGGYWQYRGSPQGPRLWEITSGAVGSYESGNPNREFVFVQGRYHGKRLSAMTVEEVDYYRGWKVDTAGESAFSLTSTFTDVHYQVGERVTFYGGYDNRRDVRLFRDVVTPVTEFDDSHRQGGWGGASFRLGGHAEVGGDLRRSTGGPNGTADGYSLNLRLDRLTRAGLAFTGRETRYANDESDGRLDAIGAGLDIVTRVHLEIGAGHLDETSKRDRGLDRSADWYDLELDLLLGRKWLLLLSTERYTGDLEDNDQYYASASYRF